LAPIHPPSGRLLGPSIGPRECIVLQLQPRDGGQVRERRRYPARKHILREVELMQRPSTGEEGPRDCTGEGCHGLLGHEHRYITQEGGRGRG
jgi:hypothetical protein